MRRELIISALLLACVVAAGIVMVRDIFTDAEPVPETPPRPAPAIPGPDTSRFISFHVHAHADSAAAPIRMYWRDDQGNDLRSLQRLRSYVEQGGKRLRFAMNGGMYHKNHKPVGLFIQNGHILSPLDTSSGKGNFYLKPNGVFFVRKDRSAAVIATERFIYSSDIEFATQSGPMLLIDGAIHPVFEQGSEHLNIRNGVGVRPDGMVIFAISRVEVNLYDFATYFKEMGCHNALYLDGFVSRCYLPEKNMNQLDGDFGVMIGITY